MNRFISTLLISFFIHPLLGQTMATPPPFDADLFRQNAQVVSIEGEFLFWRVQEGALDYSLRMQRSGWGPAECYAQGKFHHATFNTDPGFRVALSFFRAPKFWEIKGEYICINSNGHNSVNSPSSGTEFLTGTWPQLFTSPVAHAASQVQLHYDVADLCVARVFHPNPHLRLRLLGGAITAWINQFWKVKYSDGTGYETKVSNRWKFVGGGIRTGLAFDWYWFVDIYMTGLASCSGLLGSYHNTAYQTTNFQPNPISGVPFNPSLPVRDSRFKDVRAAFSGQLLLGPSYQKNFPNNRIEIFVGYELNAWVNLQEIFRSTSGSPSEAKETMINTGMLALQGLSSRITVDF